MQNNQRYEKENNIVGVLIVLWKRRWLIISGSAATTVLIIIITLILPKVYLSKAVVSLSGIKRNEPGGLMIGLEIPVYRRYSDVFCNIGLFRTFLKMKGYTDQWDIDQAGDFESQFLLLKRIFRV